MRRTRHQACVDAPGSRRGQRLRRRHQLRPGPRHHRHRRWLPPDVRAHRRRRAQDHAPGIRPQGAEASVRPRDRLANEPTGINDSQERDMVAEARLLDRLTASDLFLLMWDDYGWSSDIGGLAVLDGANLLGPGGRVRIDAVRGQLEPRLHLVPRFRQLLYRPRLGLGWPLWVDAPTMDLADHIRVRSVAAPGGQAQLLAACQDLMARRLDSARPPWELWLLPGLPNQRVGAYLRLHHAVADGAAALAVFGALLDLTADATAPAAPPWAPAPIPAAGELLADNL